MDGHLSLRDKVERSMSFLFQALMGEGHRGPSGREGRSTPKVGGDYSTELMTID